MDINFYYVIGAVITIVVTILVIPKKKKEEVKEDVSFEDKLNEMSKRLEQNFEAITNKSLAQNAEFVQSLSTNGVDVVLRPLINQLKEYQGRMQKLVQEDATGRATLTEMIKCVNDVNQSFSEEAKNFTLAIRGNIHTIGRFGEDTLQNILDASGMTEGVDYLKQKSYLNKNGDRIKPDFVILAPQNRGVLIDSKLTLNSFMKYIESKEEEQKKRHIKELVYNINIHITELSKKKYHQVAELDSFGFTLMFVASDAVLSTALSCDNDLVRNALKKGILIVGPTTMMATLKTIEYLTREQKQMESLKEIGESGKRLYEKLCHFFDRLNDVQKNFDKANQSLGTALNHLNRGNSSLVNEAIKLKDLGIGSEKEIKINNKK